MILIWLWQLAAMVIAVKAVLDYNTIGKAIIVVVIGFFVNLCVTVLLGMMFVGSALMSGAMR
jgi:hypothetical protein